MNTQGLISLSLPGPAHVPVGQVPFNMVQGQARVLPPTVTVYHYTNAAAYAGIMQYKMIRPSTDTNNDAQYGLGVYFTGFDPTSNPEIILKNNWGSKLNQQNLLEYLKKMEYCFQIQFSTWELANKSDNLRSVFVYEGTVNLNFRNPMTWTVVKTSSFNYVYGQFESMLYQHQILSSAQKSYQMIPPNMNLYGSQLYPTMP